MQMFEIHAEHRATGRFIIFEAGNTPEEATRDALKAAAKELFTRPKYIHIISVTPCK